MSRYPILFMCLMLTLSVAQGAPLSGAEIAQNMRSARLSDGFSARMNIAVIEANGKRQEPIKLSVIGQLNSQHQRLLLSGISPARIHQQRIAAEIRKGKIVAVSYDDAPGTPTLNFADNQAVFDSGLRLWDMFSPWWDWPEQQVIGTADIRGQHCVRLLSVEQSNIARTRSVVSCIDTTRRISLKTEIFGPEKNLLRTIEVLVTLRQDSGKTAAKRVRLQDRQNRITESEIYSGDENYEVSDTPFSRLNAIEK